MRRLQTRERRANEAASMMAVWRRILIRISEGILERGHSGGGEASVGRSAGTMEREEKEAMSSDMDAVGGPSREWWAVLGTVTGALDGLGSVGFDLKAEGGKCLFL